MAMTPTFALAHVFLPNLVKLKGAATVIGVIERKEKFFFDAVSVSTGGREKIIARIDAAKRVFS